jgi:hypothetical protein
MIPVPKVGALMSVTHETPTAKAREKAADEKQH